MKKPYIEIFAEVYKDFHKTLQSQQHDISEFFDKIIVWLISLSTGAIALILSSFDKLKFVNKSTLNWTLGFLVASILFGVVGRILYAVATYFGYKLSSLFDFEINLLEIPHKPRKLNGDESAEAICQFMQEDFKFDLSSILQQKKLIPKDKWIYVDENARKFYQEYSEWSEGEMQYAIRELNRIMISTFGLKSTFFEKKKPKSNRLNGLFLKGLTLSCYILYILSCLSFGGAVLKITADLRSN